MAEFFECFGALIELVAHTVGVVCEAGGSLVEFGFDTLSIWADRQSGKGPKPEL